jgi:putative transposase
MTDHRIFYHRHLPHWQPAGATLFITFRLAGSLPRATIAVLQEKCEQEERALSHIGDAQERQKQAYLDARRAFGRWDAALDISDDSPHWLTDPQVAAVVVEALHYRHERVYDLLAFCVMPNHVHLVCTPLQREDGTYHALHRILQSLKRHTARQANKVLARQGAFWQAESYDHVVRDTDELERIVQYVINNPVKAGLVSDWEAWPWTYVKV